MRKKLPYVEYKWLEPKSLGGTRGKSEYRTHTKTVRLLGETGRGHVYEGECPECGWRFFSKRKEKSKSLNKCRECGFTSFMYKGFFDPERYEVEPPSQDEYSKELWKVTYKYGDLKPTEHYGSEEYVKKHLDDEKYEVIEPPEVV